MGSFSNRIAASGQSGQTSYQTRGAQIMHVADAIRPVLIKWLTGQKNAEGHQLQPSQIRALSLTVAQDLVKLAA